MSLLMYGRAESQTEWASLVELLRWRAVEQPERQGYSFLLDGESQEIGLSYGELDRQARRIGALLQSLEASGERALLLYPPGLDYIAAFFGCLYGNVIAVPAYPPRFNRNLSRLQAIVADAQAAVVLTTSAILEDVERRFSYCPDLEALRWIATDGPIEADADSWRQPMLSGDTLAFLQYTSGSTGQPKGVMLSHGNLLHNSALIQECFEHTADSRGVSWLPPYHDMGLIGGVIQPLYSGFPVTLMAPVSFLQRPARWLQTIARTRATTSGGPNFGYDLCSRKVTPEERANLDLSSWELAASGAEPVRQETLERFAATFAECGFRREAFYPCYGLAEATLMVSGGLKAAAPVQQQIERAALEHSQKIAARADDQSAQTLVGCGQNLPDQRIVIVQPETQTPCLADQIGEIWVAGPSVAQGYWNRPETTEQTFSARLASGDGPFLRTGDLGFMQDGELFVTGRIKDLIIIRGRNHYPQDIELTVAESDPALRPGCGAAFTIEVNGAEQLVIAQEVERQHRHGDLDALIGTIRQAVAEQHDLHVYAVALLKPGSIPKTSSGKIQRHACRAGFLEDTLAIIGQSTLDGFEPEQSELHLSRAELLAAEPTAQAALATAYLQHQVARALGVASSRIDVEQPLVALGLDSLMLTEVKHSLETDLEVDLPLSAFLQGASLTGLSRQIVAQLSTAPAAARARLAPIEAATSHHPLSHGQQALWFMYQLAPQSTTHNLAFAARIGSDLVRPALRRALQALVDRHAAFRTSFTTSERRPAQQIRAEGQVAFGEIDATGWDEDQLQDQLHAAARRPFDLKDDALLRVCVFARSDREHLLLLVAPHIVADFWSLAVLMRELGELYAAEHTGRQATLAPPPIQYTDYVDWEAAMLDSAEGDRHWSYWQQQLADLPPALNLPTDRPRPPVQTYASAAEHFTLSAELSQQLKALSEREHVTLYTTLLASFQALLYRYSNQADLLVGSPMLGRSRAELSGIVGSFAKPAVLRANLSGDLPFTLLLMQVQQTVLDALEHQDYPFALLVERLQPVRDPSRSPLFQVMFNFLNVQLHNAKALGAFGLGIPGAQMDLGGLALESLALDQTIDQFDLTLVVAELDSGLGGAFHYNTDLFDADTIRRMAEHFQLVLEALVSQAEQPLSTVLARIPKPRQTVAMTATFTAEPLAEPLKFWLEKLKLPASVEFAPYNQVFQELLDPTSLIATNSDGINIVLLRLEDWGEVSEAWHAGSYAKAEQTLKEFLAALQSAVQRAPATYLVGICPLSINGDGTDSEPGHFLERMSQLLSAQAAELPGVYALDLADAVSCYQVEQVYDPFSDELGHVPFTTECFTAIGTAIARKLFTLRHAPFKVIAVDCDHTLWSGVCGEDGPLGVQLSPAHRALQEFLVGQQRDGMLLCLCTKNNEADVLDVFRQRSEMPLTLDHITARRINWEPKSENLRALADELGLALDSFIFLDDSALECAEVRARCPEVVTLPLPDNLDELPAFLDHVWAFDRLHITDEDRRRAALYDEHLQRERFRAAAPTLDDFLADLDLKVTIAPVQPGQITRAAELTQRTNQFNATTIRRSESDLLKLLQGDSECRIVNVSDRFGDYGLVGLVIFTAQAQTLEVETLLLSCRVLGRRVEDTVLAQLAQIATERGCSAITLAYTPTPKNAPVLQFIQRIGGECAQALGGGLSCTLTVETIRSGATQRAVERSSQSQPVAVPQISAASDKTSRVPASAASVPNSPIAIQEQAERIYYIATQAQTAGQIMELMRAQKRARPELESSYVAPRTAVEAVLADTWADVLGIEQVGIHDNFFELGGHSLMAIQITSRLHDAFQLELPLLTAFFETPTVAGLATAIAQAQGGVDDVEKIAQMLQQLDQLSDDEVELMLQERV